MCYRMLMSFQRKLKVTYGIVVNLILIVGLSVIHLLKLGCSITITLSHLH